jgi:uncharacterized membrane protein
MHEDRWMNHERPRSTPLVQTPSDLRAIERLGALPRIAIAAALSVGAGLLTAAFGRETGETPWLIGWLLYCALDALYMWRVALAFDARRTQARAQRDDPGLVMIFVLAMAAACASLVAVALAVQTGRSAQGLARWGHLLLAAVSLAGSWWLIQTTFARHYARVFYRRAHGEPPPLEFPGGDAPAYIDFLYHALIVGMTSQVADINVRGRAMRRLVMAHGVLSFAFNLVILALAVNVLAGTLA